MELPDGLLSPNDEADVKTETRTGPPLDYVAEKLRFTIEGLHWLYSMQNRQNDSFGEVDFERWMDYIDREGSVTNR